MHSIWVEVSQKDFIFKFEESYKIEAFHLWVIVFFLNLKQCQVRGLAHLQERISGACSASVSGWRALEQDFECSLVEGRSPCSSLLSTDPRARNIWFDAVLLKYLIGHSYLERSDMMMKSSERLWLAAEVNMEGSDWMLRYLKGLCGVFGLMLDQSSGKITALFIKAHLTEQGHLCPSQEHKQSACPAATMNSLYHKIRSGLITTCFPPLHAVKWST